MSIAIASGPDAIAEGDPSALFAWTDLSDGWDADTDAIEEIRLRTWARRNYAPASERDENWHPIILDEMSRKDREN